VRHAAGTRNHNQEDAALPEDVVVEVGGRATRVLRRGEGRPVVWLHDTLGNRWTAVHEALSGAYEVVAPSLPGFEDSTTLDGIDAPEDVVFWLIDLLAELRLERPMVIGCGLGGWMAAELAVRYPERIGGLVLVDAYGLRVDGALAADEFALTPAMLRPLLFANGQELAHATIPDQHPPETLQSALHARVAAARLVWQFPYDRKLRGRLGRARLPALVIWGQHDQLVPAAHATAYVEGLPDARLELIAAAGHYPYLERTDEFLQVVQAFLAAGA
jgi:pimeloyl-ACP methyl ester carboxylesterase